MSLRPLNSHDPILSFLLYKGPSWRFWNLLKPTILTSRPELIQCKNFYHPFSVRRTLALPYAKISHCYLDWISCQFLLFIWPSEPTYTHLTNWEVYGVRSRKLFLYPFQCTKMYVCFLLVFNGKLHFPQNLKILNELWQLVFEVIPVKLGTSWFYYLTLFMISRPLWATYIVTPEQKSSGILISELFKVRKWVVEKFHGISPGLLPTVFSDTICL